jgi:hypothetical protein
MVAGYASESFPGEHSFFGCTMASELLNIEKIRVDSASILHLKFRGRKWRPVNLAGLIAREEFLAPLRDACIFAKARVIDWGAGVGWPDDRDSTAESALPH